MITMDIIIDSVSQCVAEDDSLCILYHKHCLVYFYAMSRQSVYSEITDNLKPG